MLYPLSEFSPYLLRSSIGTSHYPRLFTSETQLDFWPSPLALSKRCPFPPNFIVQSVIPFYGLLSQLPLLDSIFLLFSPTPRCFFDLFKQQTFLPFGPEDAFATFLEHARCFLPSLDSGLLPSPPLPEQNALLTNRVVCVLHFPLPVVLFLPPC